MIKLFNLLSWLMLFCALLSWFNQDIDNARYCFIICFFFRVQTQLEEIQKTIREKKP